jgi:hypothetical protein
VCLPILGFSYEIVMSLVSKGECWHQYVTQLVIFPQSSSIKSRSSGEVSHPSPEVKCIRLIGVFAAETSAQCDKLA